MRRFRRLPGTDGGTTDSEGKVQPDAQAWNLEGVQNNAVQRVRVIANPVEQVQAPADELAP